MGAFLEAAELSSGKPDDARHFHVSCARAFPAPQAAPGFLPFFSSLDFGRRTTSWTAFAVRLAKGVQTEATDAHYLVRDTDTASVLAWGAPLRCGLIFRTIRTRPSESDQLSEPFRPNCRRTTTMRG